MSELLERVRAGAAAAAAARDAYRKTMTSLRADIRAADRAGDGRNEIVRAAEGGMSRRKVYETLGAADLLSDATSALRKLAVKVYGHDDHVFLDLSPQIFDRWDGPGDEDLPPYEQEQRDRTERRRLEDTALAALAELRAHGMTLAYGEDAIPDLIRFDGVEIVRRQP